MKNIKNYIQPEIELIPMVDVIMASGFGGGDEGDGGYAPDNF